METHPGRWLEKAQVSVGAFSKHRPSGGRVGEKLSARDDNMVGGPSPVGYTDPEWGLSGLLKGHVTKSGSFCWLRGALSHVQG